MDSPSESGSTETRLIKHGSGKGKKNAKFSEEMVQELERLFRAGHSINMALAMVAVSRTMFADWVRRSKNGDKYYLNIHERIERARAEADEPAIHTWQEAIVGQQIERKSVVREVKPMLHKDGTPVIDEKTNEPRMAEIVQERREITYVPGDWKAAEKWLEKRRSDEWGASPISLFENEPVEIKIINYREGLAGLMGKGAEAPKTDSEGGNEGQ